MRDAASAESIPAHAARQPNTAARRAEKLVLGSAPLASNRLRNGGYRLRNGGYVCSQRRFSRSSGRYRRAESAASVESLKHFLSEALGRLVEGLAGGILAGG
jgi:hypothetical protein